MMQADPCETLRIRVGALGVDDPTEVYFSTGPQDAAEVEMLITVRRGTHPGVGLGGRIHFYPVLPGG